MTYRDKVIGGSHRAAALGFPTANIPLTDSETLGIYAALVAIEGKTYPAVAFADQERNLLEAHLLDYTGDLYGQEITVTLEKKLRDKEMFENEEKLKEAIELDIKAARAHFSR